jgi:glucose-6-phosphate 1-dehydrogenase
MSASKKAGRGGDVPRSDALVIFGFTGDLASRMIFPALYAMVKKGTLTVPVIGVASSAWSTEQVHQRVRDSVVRAGGIDDGRAFDRLVSLLRYVSGDYKDRATFEALKGALGNAQRPAHYLAIPPSLFATVIESLGAAGLADNARVIVEKPFGRDLASAIELAAIARSVFPDSSIFRRPLTADDLVRGQYVGYRNEKDVAADSDVETFCALRLSIDSWRWAGVPWYLRSGKLLPNTALEVLVQLQPPPQRLFDDSGPTGGPANHLRFRLQPASAIALAVRVKHPGKEFLGDRRELYLCEDASNEDSTYERLLGDAMAGDDALFTSRDAVEAAWAVVDPVLSNHHAALPYPPGTWGPAAADDLIAGGGRWHNPADPMQERP